MPTATFSTDNCNPRLITIEPSDGCSLTRAQIRPYTKNDFESQGFKEVGMDKTIAMTKEARLVGIPQNSLTDLLLSRQTPFREGGPGGRIGNGSVVAPFTLVPQRYIVNANYFHVEAASYDTLPPGITKGANHAKWGYIPKHAIAFTVNNGTQYPNAPSAPTNPGPFDTMNTNFNSNLVNIERYFLPGTYFAIEASVGDTPNAAGGGAAGDNQLVLHNYEVVASEPHATDSTKCYVVAMPNQSETGWGATATDLNAAQKDFVITQNGLLVLLTNSISDYERWCNQMPVVNPNNLIEYWWQTNRWTHSYSDEYLAALNAPLTSEYFKRFRQLPLAEQRRQQELLNEKQWYNTVFGGDVINEHQKLSEWTQLPAVEDPLDPGCVLEYKANTLGIRTQLSNCGRTQDNMGKALSVDSIMQACYLLKRERENAGAKVDVIDAFTDRFTASLVREVMIKYYKSRYSSDFTVFIQSNQKVMDSITNKVMFQYNMYDLPDQGVSLAVFANPYFDDRLGAGPGGLPATSARIPGMAGASANRQRSFWMVDWSDVDLVTHSVKSVRRRTNVADDIYNCIITPNVRHYFLNSKKWECRVGNTNRHVMIENFSDACPQVSVPSCNLTPVT